MPVAEEAFINIHTHFKPNGPKEIVVRNAFLRLTSEQVNRLPYHISAGLHPWHIGTSTLNECGDRLIDLATNEKVFAIGEIGIDRAIAIPVQEQLRFFDVQLNIARAVQKPVIIHAVRSYSDLLPFLKKTKVPFIFHGFSGNLQQAKELLKFNCRLSFGKGLWEPKTAEVFAAISADTFLLETDNNRMISIEDVYRKAAELRDLTVDELKSAVFNTFAALK